VKELKSEDSGYGDLGKEKLGKKVGCGDLKKVDLWDCAKEKRAGFGYLEKMAGSGDLEKKAGSGDLEKKAGSGDSEKMDCGDLKKVDCCNLAKEAHNGDLVKEQFHFAQSSLAKVP